MKRTLLLTSSLGLLLMAAGCTTAWRCSKTDCCSLIFVIAAPGAAADVKADVTVDGKPAGLLKIDPNHAHWEATSCGKHTVRVVAAGYRPYESVVEILHTGRATWLRVDLEPETATAK